MASGERHAQRRRSFATGNPFPSNVRAHLSCSSIELSPGGTPDACARCAPRWGKNATLRARADDTIVRTINPRDFNRATRSTSRQINRLILLNLVREFQPISRADLARRMAVGRGMVTTLVNELLAEGAVYEGALADVPRGRRPRGCTCSIFGRRPRGSSAAEAARADPRSARGGARQPYPLHAPVPLGT